jgi:hypothetical protein
MYTGLCGKTNKYKYMKIDESVLYRILTRNDDNEKFVLVEDKITSADAEDGGADHDYVLKEVETGNFYAGSYTDWDIYNTDYDDEDDDFDGSVGGRCDLNTNLVQVYPEEVTITIYKPKPVVKNDPPLHPLIR